MSSGANGYKCKTCGQVTMPDQSAIADELETQAALFASRATERYPESVFPQPKIGRTSSPDAYAAAGYRNAYRAVAADLRARAAELRVAS